MQIRIVAIGKIKEDYLKRAIQDYEKRLSKYAKVTTVELPEEGIGARSRAEVKEREAERIKRHIGDVKYVIVLDREGGEVASEELAKKLESLMLEGRSSIAIVIGGPLGIDDSVIKMADASVSLSKLTFTHQMTRFILIEQLYRSFKIIKGEPYHY